jgi:hypothetical protein
VPESGKRSTRRVVVSSRKKETVKHFVAITDLHKALIEGMRSPSDRRVVYPKRGTNLARIRSIPGVVWGLARVIADRDAHVVVSHPFSAVTAIYSCAASKVSFYDEGTLYYWSHRIPTGPRERLYKWLTRRHVEWVALEKLPRPDFLDMLRYSRLVSFYAMYPDLITNMRFPSLQIDLSRAFPGVVAEGKEVPGLDLFLDTRDEHLPDVPTEMIVQALREIAENSESGCLYVKPHPTERSRITRALVDEPWVRLFEGNLEEEATTTNITCVYSFYSSGAVSVKLMQEECRVINIRSSGQEPDPALLRLYDRLGAEEIVIDAL